MADLADKARREKLVPVFIRLEPDLHRDAKAYARQHGVTISALCRAALRAELDAEKS